MKIVRIFFVSPGDAKPLVHVLASKKWDIGVIAGLTDVACPDVCVNKHVWGCVGLAVSVPPCLSYCWFACSRGRQRACISYFLSS